MKKLFSILIVGILCFSLFGCGNQIKSKNVTAKANAEQKDEIDTFVDKLKSSGLNVGEKKLMGAEMIGAKEGYKFDVDGSPIEIYQFDLDSQDKTTVQNIKTLKESGQLDMQGIIVKGELNNDLAIMRLDNHPDKEKIEKIFKSIK